MENNNETIKLIFPPEEENITWTKRKQRTSAVTKKSVNISEKISKLDFDPNAKASIKTDCVFCKKMIETSEYVKHLQEDHPLEYQAMCNRTKFKAIRKTQNLKEQSSKRGFEIQNRLSEIRDIIKSKSLEKKQVTSLTEELLKFKGELKYQSSLFNKLDNIPGKLNQIESYLSKLEDIDTVEKTIISQETEVKKITSSNPNNGKTTRGIEIQELLSNIQEETKRKDLNPIEKENLQNTLLSLQKEMTDEIEKFSKYDSIPVRLDQVANYLERLKEKEQQVKKTSETQKPTVSPKIEETNKNKKEKMKVIWKFGL